MPSGKCRIKQQGMTIHLLEWPKSRKRQHQMLARMWSRRHSHSLLVGMQNGTVTLENILAVSYKIKQTITINSSSSASWYLPHEVENYFMHKHLFMHIL